MSVYTLRPVADGATLQLTCSSGSTHYALVDEAAADDADYLSTTDMFGKSDILTLGTFSLPASEIITSVVVHCRVKTTGATAALTVTLSGKAVATSVTNTSYADKTTTYAYCKTTQKAWEQADISGASITVALQSAISYTISLSQLYVEVNTVTKGSSSSVLRPNADKAAPTASVYPASPANAYSKLDEAVKDTGDYIYTENGAQGNASLDMETVSIVGSINYVIIHAIIQATNAVSYCDIAVNSVPESATDWLVSTSELEVTRIYALNPTTGVAWAADDIAGIYAGVYIKAPSGAGYLMKAYQVWIEVFYTETVYMDSIICNSAGNGYVAVSGVLRNDCSTPAYKRAQVAAVADFSTVLADSTELAATESPGDTVTILFAWTPSSTGTYYARLGIRASGDAGLTWVTVAVTINFPVIAGIAVAQVAEHATITVTVTDDYADPPELTVFVDGLAVRGRLQ